MLDLNRQEDIRAIGCLSLSLAPQDLQEAELCKSRGDRLLIFLCWQASPEVIIFFWKMKCISSNYEEAKKTTSRRAYLANCNRNNIWGKWEEKNPRAWGRMKIEYTQIFAFLGKTQLYLNKTNEKSLETNMTSENKIFVCHLLCIGILIILIIIFSHILNTWIGQIPGSIVCHLFNWTKTFMKEVIFFLLSKLQTKKF